MGQSILLLKSSIDLSHNDDISDDEKDEIVMKEHGAIYSSAEKQYADYEDENLSH
jgi:hypothetical protein